MSVLRVRLFGTVQIDRDDYSAQSKISPKAQALLAYLLLYGPRLHHREMLAQLLWREYTEKQARSCLSTTLWRLRGALEPEGNISRGTYLLTPSIDEVGFNWESEYWLDVATFEKQVKQVFSKSIPTVQTAEIQLLENALQLYTGELLEGFYDDWAIREQERLNGLYLDSLEYLMRYYHYCSAYEKSLACGQRILAQEPIRESIHREIMRIYLETGQRTLAVRQYETCREVLAKELKLDPMEETQALYAQALQGQYQLAMAMPQDKLHEALTQLSLVAKNLDATQQQLRLIRQKFDQAQQEFQHAVRLVEQLTKH